METSRFSSRPVLTQTENNTTLWIGHFRNDPNDHIGGQTFRCPAGGRLNNIQVYSSLVQEPGSVQLTLHEFDPAEKSWGPVIGETTLQIDQHDTARWLQFVLDPLSLEKDKTYAFRLHTNDAMIGIGEAASRAAHPFTFGYAWNADSRNEQGHYYSYFSLAFKVELCA